MADAFTELFPGNGGSKMDESSVTTGAGAGLRRPRVVPGTDDGKLQSFVDDSGTVKAHVKDASLLAVAEDVREQLQVDAFGRLRVSQTTSLFEVTHQYDLAPSLMGTIESGGTGGSVTLSSPHAVLSVGTTNGHTIRRRSHRYALYQPGKSQLVRITGQLGNGTALAWMGYGDNTDGVFLERDNTGVYLRFRTSVSGMSSQRIAQASWNMDAMNGAGPSGAILDASKAQHFVIDLQWLAVGSIRTGLVVNGKTYYVHSFNFANTTAGAYMRTASLPIEWGIQSIGTATTMLGICAAIISEGGHDPIGQYFSSARSTAKTTLALGVRTPLIAIRPATVYGGQDNHGIIIPVGFTAIVTTPDNVLLEFIVNPASLTGASFVGIGGSSMAERDISATAITGGTTIWSEYVSSQIRAPMGIGTAAANMKDLPLSLRTDGAADILVLCVTRIANAADVFGGFNWIEVR